MDDEPHVAQTGPHGAERELAQKLDQEQGRDEALEVGDKGVVQREDIWVLEEGSFVNEENMVLNVWAGAERCGPRAQNKVGARALRVDRARSIDEKKRTDKVPACEGL